MVDFVYSPEGNIFSPEDGSQAAGTAFHYNLGDMAWVIVATALVLIMSPGVAFFYSGLVRRKNALAQLWLGIVIYGIVSFQWFFWGYSLSFSDTASSFIGDLKHFGLINTDIQPSAGGTTIPALLYCVYQLTFAAITPIIACGAFGDRARLGPIMIFVFCWSTIVYDPIANWTWNLGHGWGSKLGGLDFAGGGPVHISSGTAALAISLFLGRRKGYGTDQLAYRPQNVGFVILGTVLLWFGWMGFNGGSAIGANLRAVQAIMVTNTAAAVGGITWMFWDWRLERKWSAVGFCSGVISGLVAITPASGYVGTPASVAFGVVGATASNFATSLKGYVGIDDALDIFAAHGIGGFVGTVLTALFADNRVASFDGSALIPGGWINHHWVQLGYQLADATAIMAYSFVVTLILLFAIDRIPGCHFRASEEEETLGQDLAFIGEETSIVPLLELSADEQRQLIENVKNNSSPAQSVSEKQAAPQYAPEESARHAGNAA